MLYHTNLLRWQSQSLRTAGVQFHAVPILFVHRSAPSQKSPATAGVGAGDGAGAGDAAGDACCCCWCRCMLLLLLLAAVVVVVFYCFSTIS